ncbi:MAG: bifunctional phosphoglucose/phosphomannose isomerase [Dehalococcoidia bacterium]|nr:bifunctional phosphoglucose/phosphomannose isomerase [Dehalococcoidia bacterium]
MINLDDRSVYASLDKSGMGAQIRGLPDQCRQAWDNACQFKLPAGYSDVDKVVILGMGGSAIGGDLLRGLTANLRHPLVLVHRDYDLPAWVDEKTLVIGASYSGNTEETISGFIQALKCNCKRLVISTGGRLSELARQNKVPVFVIEHVSPPRAALGYGFLPLLALMCNLGFTSAKTADMDGMLKSLITLEKSWQEDSPTEHNQAKKLAARLHGKIAVVYGAGILTDVARRWKTQVNENSKQWAFFETLPELNHNAVLGYRHPADIADRLYVVFLRCRSLHPRTQIRYKITGELLDKRNIPHQYVDSHGGNDLKHVMSLVLLGDWVSYYLAMLNGIDPSPVPEIDLLKKRLAEEK